MGLIRQLGLPLVLKPLDSSGSRGSVVARSQEDLAAHLVPGMVAETYVHGLEMSVEAFVFQGRVLFTNLTEYLLPLWANLVPATLCEHTRAEVLELNRAVIEALGIRQGMTHLELFLTPSGPVFSEIAIRPPGGYLMDLIRRSYGFDPWQTALDLEMGIETSLPERASTVSGMWLLHPGRGTVRHISGKRNCRQIPGIREVSCRVRVGDVLTPRLGSGESSAYFIAEGSTRSDVVRALDQARKTLLIELEPLMD
jgi:biotin carboxylase